MAAADESIRPHKIFVDVLMEILVRLPGKSLMRFKSVSKYWYSLITHPVFVDKHQTRSYVRQGGVVLVHIPMDWDTNSISWDRRFMMIDPTMKNPSNRASVHEISALPGAIREKTNIVNGLICFYSGTYTDGYISIYNFTTRENLPLPPPPLRTSIVESKYHLGFDPVNKVYKVLHYWLSKPTSLKGEHCEVLTLGGRGGCENRWRSIEKSLGTPSIWHDPVLCNNGVLYWNYNGSNVLKQTIVTFSVEHEQFDFINQPQEEMPLDVAMYLCLLRGHISLVGIYFGDGYLSSNENTQDYNKITVWRLIDRNGPVWKKEVFMYPFRNCYSELECSSFGLVSLVRRSLVQNHIIIDCYMLSTGKHRELLINNAQGLLEPGAEFEPIELVENIMPLKIIDRRGMVLLAL